MLVTHNKRGIVVIVGTLLLLIAAIFFLMYFSQWNVQNSSSLFSKVEDTHSDIDIVKISEGELYVTNYNSHNVNYSNVYVNAVACNYSGYLLPGLNKINLSSCVVISGGNVYNIKLVTEDTVVSSLLKY